MVQQTFRAWLNSMWLDHKDEVREYTGRDVPYDLRDYFLKYRWWLKTIYKREKQNARHTHE